MTAPLVFTVLGPPVPWQRVTPRAGKSFMPKATRDYQKAVRWAGIAAVAAWNRGREQWPRLGTFALTLHIVFPDKRRRDLSNVTKSIEDALNGIAWADDSQIAELHVTREYDAEKPCVVVKIEAMEAT